MLGKRGTVDVVFRVNQAPAETKLGNSDVFYEQQIANAG
jgi:hypothetical protein